MMCNAISTFCQTGNNGYGICLNLGNKYCMALAEYSVAFLEPTTPNVLGMLIIGGHLGKIGQTDNHKFLLIVEDN